MIPLVLLIGGALFIALDAWQGFIAVLIASALLLGGCLYQSMVEGYQGWLDRRTAYRRWAAWR